MKKIISSSILFLLLGLSVIAQERWGIGYITIAGSVYGTIEICGDTIVEGRIYDKMHGSQWGSSKAFALRRTEGDSVFIKSASNDFPEELLYDFSLTVGDTYINNHGSFYVNAIGNEFVAGADRKTISLEHITAGYTDKWIQGIGTIIGAYNEPGFPPFTPDAGATFDCYINNDTGEGYDNPANTDACRLDSVKPICTTTATKTIIADETIKVYPNPARDYLEIEFSTQQADGTTFSLYNTIGQLIKKENITKLNNRIEVSGLHSGLYTLVIKANTHEVVRKILIE